MKLVNLQTQKYEDVPDDKVQQAFADGTHGFSSPDEQIGMKGGDGQLYHVAAKDFATATKEGAQIAPHAEVRAAELEAKYGGIGGTLAAGGESLLRGASVGISDPIAVEGTRLFAGDKAAEGVRQHLEEEKEAHPYVSGAGEIAGAVAPMLLSGGASAPLEGAELARAGAGAAEAVRGAGAADRFGSLLRAVGAPSRGVGAAGEGAANLAERTLNLVMGSPGAEGAMGRITRQAVKAGARGATEGAIFNEGQEISEDTLGDHELNAEKLVAALGHGALYGGMLGGGLGAAGGVARESFASVLNRVAPSLEGQADLQMWKALSPLKKFTTEAEARAGGARAVGRTLRDELDLGNNPLKAALTPEELAPKIDEAVSRKWDQMRELMQSTGGEVNAGKVMDALDDVIAPLRQKAGFEPVVASLETYKGSLLQKLGLDISDDGIADARLAQLRKAVGADERLEMASGHVADELDAFRDKAIPVTEVMAQRKALDELVFKETKQLDPGMRVEAMREVRGKLADLELQAFDEAAAKAGKEGVGEDLRAMRKDYQRLRIAQDAVGDTSSRMVTNRTLSLSDNMLGVAHAAGAIAAGHPLGALAGIGTAFVHKAIRERGNAAAAVALGRIAKLDLIARAAQKVDGELEGAVRAYVRGSERPMPRIRLRHFASPPTETVDERYRKTEGEHPPIPQPITPEHVERALPGLAAHAPKTAASLSKTVQAGAAYLANARPKPLQPPDLMGSPPRYSTQQQSAYMRVRGAVDDPVGTIVRGLQAGKLHKDEIDAIQATSPKLLAQTQELALAEVRKHGKAMSYDRKVQLSRVVRMPLDPTLTGPMVGAFQATFAPGAGLGGPLGPGGQPPKAPKRQLKGVASQVGLSVGRTSGL